MSATPLADARPEPPSPTLARRLLRGAGQLLGWAVAILLVSYLVGRWRSPDLASPPDFTLVDLRSGARVTLADLRGKPAVLNFWASWCGPCRLELPALERFAQNHPNIQVIGIGHDDPDDLRAAATDAGVTYRLLHDGGAASRAWGVSTLPTTFALDADGQLVWSFTGLLFDPQLIWLGLML
jgi:thiol-disulfide isomerase/thioredoxin